MSANDCTAIIINYNKEKFISRAIESVIMQSRPPEEIIIIDDASTDNSIEVIDHCLERLQSLFHGELFLLRNISNVGLVKSRLKALKHANSEFVSFLDGDDFWADNKLELQFRQVEKGFDFVYCGYNWISDGVINHSRFALKPKLKGRNVTKKLLEGNFISGSASAVLCRRDALLRAGAVDTSLHEICNSFGEDWDMWLRLSSECNFGYVQDTLVFLDDSGVYSSSVEDKNILINNFIAHFYIRSKWLKNFKSEIVEYQAKELSGLVSRVGVKEVCLVCRKMTKINCEFADAVLDYYERAGL